MQSTNPDANHLARSLVVLPLEPILRVVPHILLVDRDRFTVDCGRAQEAVECLDDEVHLGEQVLVTEGLVELWRGDACLNQVGCNYQAIQISPFFKPLVNVEALTAVDSDALVGVELRCRAHKVHNSGLGRGIHRHRCARVESKHASSQDQLSLEPFRALGLPLEMLQGKASSVELPNEIDV